MIDIHQEVESGRWYVVCEACGCRSGLYADESKAISAWNLRPIFQVSSAYGQVVVTTNGDPVTVLDSDRELARKCHEMVNEYVDCDEENSVRIALYRESFTAINRDCQEPHQ